MRTLALAALSLALARPVVAGTPFGPDDTGFVPPNKSAFICASRSQLLAAKLVTGLATCHAKLALAALGGMPVDDESCETTAEGKFLGGTSKAIQTYGCPACLVQNINLAPYAPQVMAASDADLGTLFCAGTTPLGGDDAGFVPPDLRAFKCEAVVAKALGKLRICLAKCHQKSAASAMAGRVFDEEACEHGTALSSCRVKFDRTRDKLAPLCPPCLDPATQDGLADQAEADVDATNDTFYCASPSGAFVDARR